MSAGTSNNGAMLSGGASNNGALLTGGGGIGGSVGGSGGVSPHHNLLNQSNKSTSSPHSSHPAGGGTGTGAGAGGDGSGNGNGSGGIQSASPLSLLRRSSKDKDQSIHHHESNPDLHHVIDHRKRSTILSNVAQAVRDRLHLPNGSVTPVGMGVSGKQTQLLPPPDAAVALLSTRPSPQHQDHENVSQGMVSQFGSVYSQGR